jgi:hypothetical protein
MGNIFILTQKLDFDSKMGKVFQASHIFLTSPRSPSVFINWSGIYLTKFCEKERAKNEENTEQKVEVTQK